MFPSWLALFRETPDTDLLRACSDFKTRHSPCVDVVPLPTTHPFGRESRRPAHLSGCLPRSGL